MRFDFLSEIAEILLPRFCAVCGQKLSKEEQHICSKCMEEMPLTYFWTLRHHDMSTTLNDRIQQLRDKDSVSYYEPYADAAALYFYKKGYKDISKAVKYHAELELGRYAASKLGEYLAQSNIYKDVDLVVPIPLHWMRRFKRGYNQAEVIASALARELDAPVDCRLLKRCRRTRSQARISLEERSVNVSGVFEADMQELAMTMEKLRPQHILIVDDVFTTGATLSEAQQTLRRALVASGIKEATKIRISVATLACVGE